MGSLNRHRRPHARWVAAVLLLVAAGAHIPLIEEHLAEAPYIGWSFVLLTSSCIALAVWIVLSDQRGVWILGAAVCLAALVAYLASRIIGLPEIGDDVGNWTEPLSFPAGTAELLFIFFAALHLRARVPSARSTAARFSSTAIHPPH